MCGWASCLESGLKKGLVDPSELKGDRFQQKDDLAKVEVDFGELRRFGAPVQHSYALSSQPLYCGETHGTEHSGKQSLRSRTPLDPD